MPLIPLPPMNLAAAAPLRMAFRPEQLLPVLGEPGRYRILAELIDGTPRSATQLGRAIGKARMATAKHLATLRTAGLVEVAPAMRDRRVTGYRLVPELVPPPGAPRVLDFGWCVLRFA